MRTPFILRLASPAGGCAPKLAARLRPILERRGALVRIETARAQAGTRFIVGLPELGGPTWLAPLDVPDEPEQAAREVVEFLERWGFISTLERAAS